MPDLKESFRGRDLGFLKIVASCWGIALEAPNAEAARIQLADSMLQDDLAQEIIDALPVQSRQALTELAAHDGRLPWSLFRQHHGEIRQMGPARRDREQPDRNPQSAAEILWYRALIGRAFFETPDGPEEFVYIPSDLLDQIPSGAAKAPQDLGRPATPAERTDPRPGTDHLLDLATSYLAALRIGEPDWVAPSARREFLHALLVSAGMLSETGQLSRDRMAEFLSARRPAAWGELVQTWLQSAQVDELRLLPGLRAEGDWKSEPLKTRRTVLGFLADIPTASWWSLGALIGSIKDRHPHYQRPDGNYDRWYIRRAGTETYLRGFESWDLIDGTLVRYLICGPLHWLGLVDLAGAPAPLWPDGENVPLAFRFPAEKRGVLSGKRPRPTGRRREIKIHVRSDGRIDIPRQAARTARYQVARFTVWLSENQYEFRYQLTPSSLEAARHQGLRVQHLLSVLSKHSDGIPPNVSRALWTWEKEGAHARIEKISVLRLATPEMLRELRGSRARRFLGDLLGPTAVVLKPGTEDRVLALLAEMGWLAEISADNEH